MSLRPWRTDRPLDAARVRALSLVEPLPGVARARTDYPDWPSRRRARTTGTVQMVPGHGGRRRLSA